MSPVAIADLDLEANDSTDWKLLGRIAHKSGPIPTARGYQFNFVLEDSSAHIRVFVPDEFFDKFFETIVHGELVEITRAFIELSRAPDTLRNIFEDSIPSDMIGRVQACTHILASVASLPAVPLRQRPRSMEILLREFDSCKPSDLVNLDVAILLVGDYKLGPNSRYRLLRVIDESLDDGHSIILSLWREQAEHFRGQVGQVLSLQAATVSTYFSKDPLNRHKGSLSHGPFTSITLNPTEHVCVGLVYWLQRLDLAEFGRRALALDQSAPITLVEINVDALEERLAGREHASVSYSIDGSFAYIQPVEQHVYPGCSHCLKARCYCRLPLRPVLFVQAAIRDGSSDFFAVSIPCKALATYFGLSPDGLLALHKNQPTRYTAMIDTLRTAPRFTFRISARLNIWQERSSIKASIISFEKA